MLCVIIFKYMQQFFFSNFNLKNCYLSGQDGKEQRSRSQKDRSERILFTKGTQTTPENSIGLTQRPNISSVHSASLPSLHHIGIPDPSQQDFLLPNVPPISFNRYCPPYRGADNISYLSRLVADNATLRKENEEVKHKNVAQSYKSLKIHFTCMSSLV